MNVCENCGLPARPGVDFCTCGAYVSWDDGLGGAPASGRDAAPFVREPTPAVQVNRPPRPVAPNRSNPGPPPEAPAPTPPGGSAASADLTETRQLCPSCGAPNPMNRRFCRLCGTALAREDGPAVLRSRAATDAAAGDAPAPTRQPSAERGDPVVPQQPAPSRFRPDPDPPGPRQREPEPGSTRCPQCGTFNPPGRRFCERCGVWIAMPGAPTAPVPVTGRPGLVDRLRGRRSSPAEAQHREATRDARRQFRRTLSARWRVGRVVAVVGVLGLLGGGAVLAGADPGRRIGDLRERVTGGQHEEVIATGAATTPQTAELNDFPASASIDGGQPSAWAVRWLGDPGPVSGCGAPATSGGAEGQLVLRVPPTRLTRVVIEPGSDPRGAIQQWRPVQVDVRLDGRAPGSGGNGGTCQTFELENNGEAQEFDLESPEGAATANVTVTVRRAQPAKGADAVALVAIREIRLYRDG